MQWHRQTRNRLKFTGLLAFIVLWLVGIGTTVSALAFSGLTVADWSSVTQFLCLYVGAPAAILGTAGLLVLAHAGFDLEFGYGTALAAIPFLVAPLYAALQALAGPLDPSHIPVWLRRGAVAAPLVAHVHGIFALCRDSLRNGGDGTSRDTEGRDAGQRPALL